MTGLLARLRREWGLLAICGVGWFGVYNVALNAAEHHLDAGTTAMLVNVGPILIAVFAGLFLGEGFPRWLVVGITVAFAGVVVILRPEGGNLFPPAMSATRNCPC